MDHFKYYIIDFVSAVIGLTVGLLLSGLVSSRMSLRLYYERGYSAVGGEIFLYALIFAGSSVLIFYALAYGLRMLLRKKNS